MPITVQLPAPEGCTCIQPYGNIVCLSSKLKSTLYLLRYPLAYHYNQQGSNTFDVNSTRSNIQAVCPRRYLKPKTSYSAALSILDNYGTG